jgi:hypothetical protein
MRYKQYPMKSIIVRKKVLITKTTGKQAPWYKSEIEMAIIANIGHCHRMQSNDVLCF